MTNNIKCLFICLFAICISSLVKYLFVHFAYFLTELFGFFYCSVLKVHYIFYIPIFWQICCLQIFFPISSLFFHPLHPFHPLVFFRTKVLNFLTRSGLSLFPFMDYAFGIPSENFWFFWFSDTNWMSNTLIQFWHCLPGVSIRSHKLKSLVPQDCPHLRC